MNALTAQFDTPNGLVELDEETVRAYLVNGDGKVTNQEVAMFIKLCQYQGLNPFLREAYLIKYSDKTPAAVVVGKDAFTRRAAQIEECKGWSAGVAVMTKRNEYVEREGTIVLPDEKLVGGWCEVQRDGWNKPFKASVNLNEYNAGNSMWQKKPATMIRKVALVQALREAFPDKFQGMYDQAEMGIDSGSLPETEIAQNPEQRTLSKEQLKALMEATGSHVDLAKAVLISYGYNKSSEVLVRDFAAIMRDISRHIENIETEHEGGEIIDLETGEIQVDDSDLGSLYGQP